MKLFRRASYILAFPDLQCPFQHQDYLAFIKTVQKEYVPKYSLSKLEIVCLGDEVDAHAMSQYGKDPDGHGANKEIELAIDALKPIYELYPHVLVCESNHTNRPAKKAFDAGIPKRFLKSFNEWLSAPKGWKWDTQHTINDIRFEHGESHGGPLGAIKTARDNMQSTVIGHHHSEAGILWFANDIKTIFGFNVGCLIDEKAYAFNYQRKFKKKPVLGVGIIKNNIPFFIPMYLNSKGRWNGKV